MTSIRTEIRDLAAAMLADGKATIEADARVLAQAHLDGLLRYADGADEVRLTNPKMEAINIVAAALQGRFKRI